MRCLPGCRCTCQESLWNKKFNFPVKLKAQILPFKAEKLTLPDALLIKPSVFEDERGHFLETYNKRDLAQSGIQEDFVQDNQSLSAKNVLRGFHFQAPPHGQAKLVKVVSGRALDVIIDIRKGSPAFGEVFSCELNDQNMHQLYIPEGFAHAFLSLEENTILQYKCSRFYNKESEGGIRWNDPSLAVNWAVPDPQVSAKDEELPFFKDFKSPFHYGQH